MYSVLRLCIVMAAVVAVVGSASSPSRHKVQPAMTINEAREDAWAGLLELFAEKRWATKSVHEKSGLITTDWIELGNDAERYADCGEVPLVSKPSTQVKLDVRVSDREGRSVVSVSSSFRQRRSPNDTIVDCASRGSIETMIHNEVAARANNRAMKTEAAPTQPPPEPTAAPRGFYCASSASSPKVSICARQMSDCERGSAAIANAVDIGACALVESAWCFDAGSDRKDERCSASTAACTVQREAAGSAARTECVETR